MRLSYGWNATTTKLMMAFLMFLDHIYQFIPGAPIWLTYLGRLVAPVFFYLLVESYHHTSNRVKLIQRLYLFGLLMLVGSNLLVRILPGPLGIPNNILLNMALCLTFLECLERLRAATDKKRMGLLAFSLLISMVFISFTEGSYLTLALVLIFHFLRKRPMQRDLAYGLLALSMTGFDFSYESLFVHRYQWMMLFSILFFRLYNGARGRTLKYFFYWFYPLHVWGLYVLGTLLRG